MVELDRLDRLNLDLVDEERPVLFELRKVVGLLELFKLDLVDVVEVGLLKLFVLETVDPPGLAKLLDLEFD